MKFEHVKLKKCFAAVLCSLGLSLISTSASAVCGESDLVQIYEQARSTDPVFQGAYAKMLADQENLPQSASALLPNISGTANSTYNYLNVLSISGVDPVTAEAEEGVQKYNSNGYALNLTQNLFNFSVFMQVAQSNNIYKQAAATYCAATEDLIIRVAEAYFKVLLAQDDLVYTRAQKAANARQLDQTKQRYDVGLDAITSVYNAQAAYDAIVAQEIAAENTLRNTQEGLRQITGVYYCSIADLKIELPLIKPCPLDPDEWVASATQHNYLLLATRYAADAARAAIKVFFGGHLPSVQAVASYSKENGSSLGTLDLNQGAIGVQVNVPIFQGGYVSSQVRQAQDNYALATDDMEKAYRQAVLDTQQNYNDVMSGISKITADRAAILSAQSSVDSTEESFKVGTRTIVDVLIAQQQLFEARKNYAQDEYSYLLSTLKLKQAAGILCAKDLCQINNWLHGPDHRDLDNLAMPAQTTYTGPTPVPSTPRNSPNLTSPTTTTPISPPRVVPVTPVESGKPIIRKPPEKLVPFPLTHTKTHPKATTQKLASNKKSSKLERSTEKKAKVLAQKSKSIQKHKHTELALNN